VFHLLPRHTLAAALVRKRGLPEDDAWFLAALAQGSLGRGIEMDIDAEKALRDEVLALWSGLGRFSPGETLHQAEAYGKDRERLERLLDIGIEWFRDAWSSRDQRGAPMVTQPPGPARQWCERHPEQEALDRRVAQFAPRTCCPGSAGSKAPATTNNRPKRRDEYTHEDRRHTVSGQLKV
jgi:hypothetical protein